VRNRHGLTRDIPEPVKRAVRQACGFGCVVCGASIIEYEHVDPGFADAREHGPANLTLLCPQCHSKVTTGIWSKEKIKVAMTGAMLESCVLDEMRRRRILDGSSEIINLLQGENTP
jgi:HNH endonuclease